MGEILAFGRIDGWGKNHCVYPILFSISSQKEAKVGDVVSLHGGVRVGDINWRRRIFLWELNLIDNLMASLEGVNVGSDEDRWVWLPEEVGGFSKKSAYTVLERILLVDEELGAVEE